jgi:UDP-2,3-diacylglucosamine pyrophosphatase LpxH
MTARLHTVVLSDVHLSQAHPQDESDPAWMRYRTRAHHPDKDFSKLVDLLLTECPDAERDRIELCFNGDIFDFDAPWVKDGESSFDEFPLSERGCAEHIVRIIADHDTWFSAIARVIDSGHRVLFLSGNHDIELCFEGVQRAVREAILSRSTKTDVAEETIRFRRWFHLTEARVYLEHGSQYDFLNNVRHAMLPVTRSRDHIHPVCGKLAFKRTGSRMGYFNPYYEETFFMSAKEHLTHFAQHYALSTNRHIARTWVKGAIETTAEILRERHTGADEAWVEEGHALAVRETGATTDVVRATYALSEPSGEQTMLPILRELWLDRVAWAGALPTAAVIAALLGGKRTAAYAGLGALALFATYEVLTPKPDLRTYDSAPERIVALFDIHQVRAIAMGHTHRPFGRWTGDRFSGNSGAWCPAFVDKECTQPVLDGRPFLWLTADGPKLTGGLKWMRHDALVDN